MSRKDSKLDHERGGYQPSPQPKPRLQTGPLPTSDPDNKAEGNEVEGNEAKHQSKAPSSGRKSGS